MPFYHVHHSYPLSQSQQDTLAQLITKAHTQIFTVPAAFVNVNFLPYNNTPHYIAGKRVTGAINVITGDVRPGRPREQYEQLSKQVESAWIEVVGADDTRNQNLVASEARLGAVFVLGSIITAYEQGFFVPTAGRDGEWLKENLGQFKKLAEGGNEHFRELLAELEGREDFKAVLATDGDKSI